MSKVSTNLNLIALKIRRDWGKLHPGTKVMKSKKSYNRKDKSWKNDI